MQGCTVRRVFVFGGSAGGIESLCAILKELPADFSAGMLAVIHTTQKSAHLAEVVGRCTNLEVVSPNQAEPISTGRIYLAAPNRHLVVKSQCAVSWMGPRENRHRPAVDTLFRTAARVYRSHVVAVVLSGALDDGSAGVTGDGGKSARGHSDRAGPERARMEDMPANVLRQVETDYCLPAAEISPLLTTLASEGRAIIPHKPSVKECRRLSEEAFGEMEPPGLTCPDCGWR